MNRIIFLVVIAFIINSAACSRAIEPASPDFVPSINSNSQTASDFNPFIVTSKDASGETGNVILGIYEGHVDLASMEYHFTPLRTANAIGDSFEVDLTYYLDGVPCGNCLRIGRISINSDNNLEILFEAKHPFPAVGSRLDLPVFDVRGILINRNPTLKVFYNIFADMDSDSTPETPIAGDIDFLLNADGYSTFFDIVTEEYLDLNIPGNLNPYKLFFVDPTNGNFNPLHPNGVENINQPIGHNVFAQGVDFNDDGASQNYIIKAGTDSTIDFLFILESAYGQSATFANTVNNPGQPGSRTSPKFFVPEFNRKEAWKVETEITLNRIKPYDAASIAEIEVRACDWQAGVTPSGEFGPDAALNDIRHPSDVASVMLDVPGIIDGALTKTLTDASGNGNDANPYIWTFSVTNDLEAKPGNYAGVVCIRDEICTELDGTTPPFGVRQDTEPVDFRDFATYTFFTIQIPGLEGKFQADPYRQNLDIVTGITQPTSNSVELDLAVVENDNPNVKGVYMPDANNGITRYNFNYTDAVFHGPGLLPPNTTNTHPNPNSPMPIRRLDANSKGVTMVAYYDANETYQPNPGYEPTLPAGNIVRMFYCILPPPVPPYDPEFPLKPFGGYFTLDTDDPNTPSINESLVEDPIGLECWDDFNGNLGAVWETTKLPNSQNGLYDILYLGVAFTYPPDTTAPPTPDPQFFVSLTGIPANEIRGMDISSNAYLYYGLSGPNTPAGGSLWVGFDAEDPGGNPLIGGFPVTTGNVIDLELLPYDSSMTRIINNYEQTNPLVVVLTDQKTIQIMDSITGQVFQLIDGAADGTIVGTPKHLDVGDKSFTIHVTQLDGTTPRVTVYELR